MSLKELDSAMKSGAIKFGLKETLKQSKAKKKASIKVFVVKDARVETIEKLQKNGINFEFLKMKKDISNWLGLDFESEVFLIKQND